MRVIQLKRGLRANLPSSAQPGEVLFALDTRELFAGNASGNVVRVNDVIVSDSQPANAVNNLLWLDTNSNTLMRYNGTEFVPALDIDAFGDVINNEATAEDTTWSSSKIVEELDGKADEVHEHTVSEVTDFQTEVDGAIEGKRGEDNGLAPLDENGIVPLAHLPSEVKETKVVNTIAERDAITDPYESLFVLVVDATDDPEVESGGALYAYHDNAFVLVSRTDELEVDLDWENLNNIPQVLLDTELAFTQAVQDEIDDKATKAASVAEGNLLTVDAEGDLADSGYTADDFLTGVIDGGTFPQ